MRLNYYIIMKPYLATAVYTVQGKKCFFRTNNFSYSSLKALLSHSVHHKGCTLHAGAKK